MDCPKCGASQDDGREDCISCGIVFRRFREAQERAMLARRSTQDIPLESSSGQGLTASRAVLFLVVFLLLVFGGLWTKSRRDARANRDLRKEGMSMLDDINRKAVKERQRLEEEAERANKIAAAMSEIPKPVKRPIGMDEADATRLIEQCSGFRERASIKFPRVYQEGLDYSGTYPRLAEALRLRIVEKSADGTATLWPGPGVGGIEILNQGDEYEIDLGFRRVQEITALSGGVDRANADFRWMWQGRVAAETLLTDDTYTGIAELVKNEGSWRVLHATAYTQGGGVTALCKENGRESAR
ncbi:MAG: hypothetical protein ACXW28_06770 [Thermoanaerobaculia bacterium]